MKHGQFSIFDTGGAGFLIAFYIIDSLYYIWFGGSRIFDRKYIRYAKIDLLLSSVLNFIQILLPFS